MKIWRFFNFIYSKRYGQSCCSSKRTFHWKFLQTYVINLCAYATRRAKCNIDPSLFCRTRERKKFLTKLIFLSQRAMSNWFFWMQCKQNTQISSGEWLSIALKWPMLGFCVELSFLFNLIHKPGTAQVGATPKFLVGAFINKRARLLQSLVFLKTDSKRRTLKLTFNY